MVFGCCTMLYSAMLPLTRALADHGIKAILFDVAVLVITSIEMLRVCFLFALFAKMCRAPKSMRGCSVS